MDVCFATGTEQGGSSWFGAGATVLGALVGAGAVILANRQAWKRQQAAQKAEWERNERQATERRLRGALARLSGHLAQALHSMAWLTWVAAYTPHVLRDERERRQRIDAYHREMHAILPRIATAETRLAIHASVPTVDLARREVKKVYAQDADLAAVLGRYTPATVPTGDASDAEPHSPNRVVDEVTSELAARLDAVRKLADSIPVVLGRLVGDREGGTVAHP
jgi:hypothetical protein